MATCSRKFEQMDATFTSDYQDVITEHYFVRMDTETNSPTDVLNRALVSGPDPIPNRGAFYADDPFSNLFAHRFNVKPLDESRLEFNIAIGYRVPDLQGRGRRGGDDTNPFLRAPEHHLEYMASEQEIRLAKNVEALPHGDGEGGERAEGTLGPVTNAVGEKPDIGLYEPFHDPVIVVRRNFETLDQIVSLNEDYQWTTNEDEVAGFSQYRLKYLLTEEEGLHQEGNFKYYMGVTRIQVMKTTNLILDNFGYSFWNGTEVVKIKVPVDGGGSEDASTPRSLKRDGTLGKAEEDTTITYQYLTPTNFHSLIF